MNGRVLSRKQIVSRPNLRFRGEGDERGKDGGTMGSVTTKMPYVRCWMQRHAFVEESDAEQ